MESTLVEFAITLLLAWMVWRFVARSIRNPNQPAEPQPRREPEPDDFAGSPARIGPRPRPGAGTVALAEPEDDEADPPPASFIQRR